MVAERLNHLAQQGVGLLDLLLLGANFFLRLRNVGTVTVNHRGGFGRALAICLDPALRRKNPVLDRLKSLTSSRRLQIQSVQALAESGQIGFLGGNFRFSSSSARAR